MRFLAVILWIMIGSSSNAFVATPYRQSEQSLSTARFNSYLDSLGRDPESIEGTTATSTTVSIPVSIPSNRSAPPDDTVHRLKKELMDLGTKTKRGFSASSTDRSTANRLIQELKQYNPTTEPAESYYSSNHKRPLSNLNPSLAGAWTLLYTDAPDITSLDTAPTAQLGRIGQDCTPPFITNVIEWKRPAWAAGLPFSGSDRTRLLQKVVTKATASPNEPTTLQLNLVGIEVLSDTGKETDLWKAVQESGVASGLVQVKPINLKGKLQPYFGTCSILYLDDELRIIKTGQNYVAVNRREKEPWF